VLVKSTSTEVHDWCQRARQHLVPAGCLGGSGTFRRSPPCGSFLSAAALRFGKIAAAVLPEPFTSRTELALGVTPLADLDQGAARAKRFLCCADHAG
jgi:hypothetical protein